jgi:hypothetical protein
MTEQAPAVPVPKAMVLTRLAFAAGGALGLAYVVLGPLELSHLDAGYAAATHYVALPDVYAVASSIRDFTGLAIGASVIAAAPMLPFAARASSLVVASWFPLAHYVTAFGLMAAGVVGAAGLSTSSVRKYVRRHDQAGPDDPRLWTLPKRDAT